MHICGALWWTRTTDPRFRKPMLYPAELRAQYLNLLTNLFERVNTIIQKN
jgi:hypothetical protein